MDDILASIRSAMTGAPGSTPAGYDDDVPHESAEGAPELREVWSPPPVAAATGIGALQVSAMTVDALMRSMLEPMLKTWLDANLPEIVEGAAVAEIARLTGRGG